MRRFSMGLVIGLALVTTLSAGEPKTGFNDRIHKGKDGDSKFVVFIPHNYSADKEFPIILFLHGAGGRGIDGKRLAIGGLAEAIRSREKNFGFIVVFPQAEKTWQAGSADANRALAILDEVKKEYKADSKRVYLTGLSMGGYGTWSLAAAHPDRWAAIAPVCGGGSPANAEKIKHIPCWCFHGDKDTTVRVEQSRQMIKALKDAGAEPRYSEFPDVGHNSWDAAYATSELYQWFLSNKLK
ncbi:MAG: prolyl oligopeptidase family serine peptidase [Planctomycetes bacterium]|nr:prolyl oligopeptidase family serine peptidase [Planctomycetota bacterium]